MTVGRLKELLKYYDDSMPIVFQAENSMYGDRIGGIENYKGVCSFGTKSIFISFSIFSPICL